MNLKFFVPTIEWVELALTYEVLWVKQVYRCLFDLQIGMDYKSADQC